MRLAFVALAFGALVTVHVAIVLGLAFRRPRWRSLVAIVVPPFAPYWAWQERWRTSSALWLTALVTYGVALFIAAH